MPSSDFSFARKLPKIELHRHLEGAMRLSTLVELARSLGLPVPQKDEEIRRQFLVMEPMRDLAVVLEKFKRAQAVLHSPAVIERLTFEAIEDAANENIRLLELRYAPTYIADNHDFKSWEEIHLAVLRGLKRAAHLPVAVGFIGILQRTRPVSEAASVMDFFIDNKDSFVGVDLADSEAGFDCKPFAPIFQRAKASGLRVTIHAGEADIPEASQSVRDAVAYLGAERIGHGVQIYKDSAAIDFVCSKDVVLELCPTSNWLTQAVSSVEKHPIKQLLNAGVKVTINSDDPDLFAIDLTNEIDLSQKILGLSEVEIRMCQENAFEASFIPDENKREFEAEFR